MIIGKTESYISVNTRKGEIFMKETVNTNSTQEKIICKKKNGMSALLLITLLYLASIVGLVIGCMGNVLLIIICSLWLC